MENVMLLAEQMASSAAMRRLFSARATVQAMLDVEAGLAQAGAVTGMIPGDLAKRIEAACKAEGIDIDKLADEGAVAGTVVVPLVNWLRNAVPEARDYVHLGGTSQDIIDTGLVLQLRAGIALLEHDLEKSASAAAHFAEVFSETPMLGRTLLQAAMPMTFGLKAANWLVALDDSRRAIRHAAAEALCLQYGGAAGTADAVGENVVGFIDAFGNSLGLPVPPIPWHTRRAPLARLATSIAGAVGVAGKIGTDIALLMQSEIAEVMEPAAPGRGGSSAMTHKRNPALSITARAAAQRITGFAASLLGTQDQEHERAAGAWQAEAAIWPALMLCASGGLAAIAEVLPGLAVKPAAMAANLARLENAHVPPGVTVLIGRALEYHRSFEKNRPIDDE
jgi:3-carboxy-cis,cis-muconate cycloisomerase